VVRWLVIKRSAKFIGNGSSTEGLSGVSVLVVKPKNGERILLK
jgi:hypothetical protein